MDPFNSLQRINYFRLLRFLLDVGTEVFKEVFKKRYPTVSSYGNIIEPNRSRLERLMHGPQRDIIFPSGYRYRGDLSDINISSLYTLLRNIGNIQPHNNGWGKDPDETDRCLSANIERIRNVRNTIEHLTSAALPEDEFNKLWECLRTAILEIGGQTYADRIDELLVLPIDEEAERYYLERLKSLQTENKDVIGRISKLEELTAHLDLNSQSAEDDPEVMKRKDELDRFVVTKSATKALELLRQNQVLLLRGSPGSGKSITAFYIAYALHNREKYFIHFTIEPSDILKYKNDDKKHIFIFDDVCGTVHTNQYNAERWKTYRNDVTKVLTTKSLTKILLISRTQVDVNDLFVNIFRTTQKEVEITVSLPERKKIASKYLKDDEVAKLDDNTIELFPFFPLLCVLFNDRNDPKLNIENFFKQPYKCIENELSDIRFNSKPCFIALCYLVIFNNNVNKETLQNDEFLYKYILPSLLEEFKVESPITCIPLESSFLQMVGTFVIESMTSFTCLHDAMFDMIAKFVGETIPKTIIRFGHSYLIRDRVQIETTNTRAFDPNIVIRQEFQNLLMQRLIKEMRRGFYRTAFNNQMTKSKRFRSQLISFIEEHISSINFSFSALFELPLLVTLSVAGYMDFIDFFIAENEQLVQDKMLLERCLIAASWTGNIEVVRFLLKYEFDIDSCKSGGTALILASLRCYEDIVSLLIQNSANVNVLSKLKQSALHVGSAFQNFNIVCYLVKSGALVNGYDIFRDTPLHLACSYKNLDIIKLLVKNHADINSKNNKGVTPLHNACRSGHTNIVKYLVCQKADLFKSTVKGFKAIHYACLSNEPKLVEFLLDQGMDINDGHLISSPPLIVACESGSTEVIKALIKRGVNINCKDKYGSTALFEVKGLENAKSLVSHGIDINTVDCDQFSALHCQCFNGTIDVIEYLLTLKVNINEGHLKNETPLHIACAKGRKDVVLLLLKNSANINSLSNDEMTPLHLALCYKHYEIAEILFDHGANSFSNDVNGTSVLHAACYGGNLSIVNKLLKEKVKVNEKDAKNRTPLFFAIGQNHKDIVQTLIDHTADLNIQCLDRTPLMLSVEIQNVEITDMLIAAGSKVNLQSSDKSKYTALHIASEDGNTRLVKLLIRNNASVDGRNSKLLTPLHLASYKGHLDVVSVLLKNGASILAEDEDGRSALHYAVDPLKLHKTSENVVKILIKKGIEINKKTRKECVTALHIATAHGHLPLVELLIKHKTEINCLDIYNGTPLHHACYNGYVTIVQLFLKHSANTNISNTVGYIPFHISCSTGQTMIVDLLIKHGTKFELTTTKGYTGLYLACKFRHLKTVERLLMESKFVELIDKNQNASISAFHIACKSGHIDIVKILSVKPIQVSAISKKGRNCLHFACHSGNLNLVEFLVNLQLDMNCQSVKGDTPLHWACFLGYRDIVKVLLKLVSNINIGSGTYFTPLHAACFKGHLDIVRLLVDHSADIYAKTKSGKTVLGYAYKSGNTALINLVKKLQK